MLACFRSSKTITDLLIDAGADVFKEDQRGVMALSYAISSAVINKLLPPFEVVDKIVSELGKFGFTFSDYLQVTHNFNPYFLLFTVHLL